MLRLQNATHRAPRAEFRPGWRLLLRRVSLLTVVMATLFPAQSDTLTQSVAGPMSEGIRLLEQRDPAAAKTRFDAALAADPRSADARTWRGIAENQLQQYNEAAKDFEAALRLQPDSVAAHYNLALSLIRLGQTDHAIAELQQVIRARPGVFEPEYNLALLLEEKHDTGAAIEHLQVAERSHPDDPDVMQHLAADLALAGRGAEAQPILDRLQSSAGPEILSRVSSALLEGGDFRQAIPLLEALRVREPGRAADLVLARACIGAHEDARAVAVLGPDQNDDPNGDAALLTGLAHLDEGATSEARAAFEAALRSNPRNAEALYRLGLMESGDAQSLSQASGYLEEAMRLSPGNADYGLALGRVLLERNQPQSALDVLQSLHTSGPRAGQRDLLLGIAAIVVRGPAQAMPFLQSAVAEDPHIALSHDMLAFCYFTQGDVARASASWARASDLQPATLIFAHSAAVAFDRANDLPAALKFATRAAALPDAGAADHELLGKLYARAGKTKEAIHELTTAVSLDPDLEAAYFLLGRTCMQSGDQAQAKIWVDRLREVKRRQAGETVAPPQSHSALSSSTLLRGAPAAQQSQQ